MRSILTGILLCAVSLSAAASEFDYSHLDLAYTHTQYDFTSGSGNGYEIAGSWELGQNGFVLEAAYRHARFGDITGFPFVMLKPVSYRAGAAYHMPAGEFLDFVAHADYVSAKTTLDPGSPVISQSSTGYVLGVGLRGKVSDAFELDAAVDHGNTGFMRHGNGTCNPVSPFCASAVNWQQDGVETVLSLAGRYHFTHALGLGLEYRHSSLQGGQEWLLSGRWKF